MTGTGRLINSPRTESIQKTYAQLFTEPQTAQKLIES